MAEKKYLVEFLAQWIRDEDLRRKVLHKEVFWMDKWGLAATQSADLRSLAKQDILNLLVNELEADLKIDLAKILKDIDDTGGKGPGAAGAYDEGKTHVRGIEPQKIKQNLESIVIVRGHGWDDSLKVFFVPASGQNIEGKVLGMHCDIDVWQRATVKMTLPTQGKWRVMGRVVGNNPTDSSEPVQLEVE
jgi:hypothetical protein